LVYIWWRSPNNVYTSINNNNNYYEYLYVSQLFFYHECL
jgi:hypothetical protein